MDFGAVTFDAVTKDLTYSEWLHQLTPEQRSFVDSPPVHSIKVRGPAGSGKSLALELKALREVDCAR